MMVVSDKRVKIFYLPFNRDVLFGLVGVIILISFGVLNFSGSQMPAGRTVFTSGDEPSQLYYHGPTDKQEVALKINVAWGEDYLPQMLNILSDHDVSATFFFLGRWVEKFPELVEEVQEEGHQIGNHGFRHLDPTELSEAELRKLIKENNQLLEEVTGEEPELFAPPYGEADEEVARIAEQLGTKTILWSADTIDWQRPEPEVIVERAVEEVDNGGIILMHPTAPTVEALPQIITKLQERGYNLVTISELLE